MNMDTLPAELILHIVSLLAEENAWEDIVHLQATSKRLLSISRDNELWRQLCYDKSYSESLRKTYANHPIFSAETARRTAELIIARQNAPQNMESQASTKPGTKLKTPRTGRARALSNWDPSYSGERVDWYGEYVARHAPISLSWLQQPKLNDRKAANKHETKGMGFYKDSGGRKVVGPLDDGSVCVWNLDSEDAIGTAVRPGAIFMRSKPGLLSSGGASSKAKITSTSVVECVSIDSFRTKAYIAVQNGLNEVDLNTLQVSHLEKYPYTISALSETHYPTPLTVGTTLSLHLHDPRRSSNSCWSESGCEDRVDTVASFPTSPQLQDDFHRLVLGDGLPKFASLYQSGPLSIQHFPGSGSSDAVSGEIYVAGRFPSLLVYDRRSFPKLKKTIHSGARLCGFTSLPYLWEGRDERTTRRSRDSQLGVEAAKSLTGKTLVACGEYNGKGSLEMYGVTDDDFESPLPIHQDSKFHNRVSASRTKLLSVVTQGSRLVVSDGDGQIRWMERDGLSLVRSWNINNLEEQKYPASNLFTFGSAGDVALKLLPTNNGWDDYHLGQEDLLVWTGERIGVLAFKPKPQFQDEDWEEALSAEEQRKENDDERYGQAMRRELERQADEARFMQRLGASIHR